MSKTSNLIRTIVEVAVFAAIGFALDTLQGGITKPLFPNGGSIGIAMIAVIILGMRRGMLPALGAGLIIGIFDFLTGPYIVHPLQAILDYITPYAFVSISALFRPLYLSKESKKEKILVLILAVVAGGLGKFLSHFFAGFFFLNDSSTFAWGLENINPYFYCFLYNMAFIGPSIILTSALLAAIESKAPFILTKGVEYKEEKESKESNITSFITSATFIAGGLAIFLYYFIFYIQSIYTYADEVGSGFDANGDQLALSIFSFIIIGIGIYGLICNFKKLKREDNLFGGLSVICMCSAFYATGITLKGYFKSIAKGKEYLFDSYKIYILWICISFVTAVLAFLLMLYFRKKRVAEKEAISTN